MENEYVLIKAKVIRKQDSVLTVRLEDGFGNNENVVHEGSVVAAK